ncbi:MAG: DUF6261 family protein [Bacteroidota bacterium]
MIKIPDFSTFRNGEFVKFTDFSITIVSKYNFDEPKLQEQIDAVKTVHQRIRSIYKTDRGSNLTQDIVQEDLLRDNMNSAIRLILRAHTIYHTEEAIREKAQNVMEVFEKHGTNLNRQSYIQQTVNLDDIFKDIKDKDLLEAINELGIGFYYKKLVKSNHRFNKLYLERNKEYASAPREKISDLRPTSEETIKELFNMINAAVVFYGKKYEPLINELNSLVESYQTGIARRHGMQKETDENLNRDFDEIRD